MEPITWSPKLPRAKIFRLYNNDAIGAVDDVLIEDVGLSLLLRCQSIRLVTGKQVECPRCGTEFTLSEDGSWKMKPEARRCPSGCGWETTPDEWHKSWRHRDLLGTAAIGAVQSFLRDYPASQNSQQRMICIDQLIHAFHVSLRTGKAGRSFANNLIEGSHKQVAEFLDGLSSIEGGVDKQKWRSEMGKVFLRRQGRAPDP